MFEIFVNKLHAHTKPPGTGRDPAVQDVFQGRDIKGQA